MPSAPAARSAAPATILERLGVWRVPLLGAASGLLLAYSFPGYAIPALWVVTLVPLWLAVWAPERAGAGAYGRALAACLAMGLAWAAVTGDWMINTLHVYGGVPLLAAHAMNLVGHSLLVGAEFFVAVAVPCVLARRRPRLALLLVPLWAAAVQAHWPHLFMWSFGQFMWQADALVQAADLVGSAGLNLIYLPLELVLFAWVSAGLGRPVVRTRELAIASAIAGGILIAAWTYGAVRSRAIEAAAAGAADVPIVAIQPNFSLKRLASNPDLSPADREQSLDALLRDSEAALTRARRQRPESAVPIVLIWPESVYPTAYLLDTPVRELVERWVQANDVHLILASLDQRATPDTESGRSLYGISVHVKPDGGEPSFYRKIFLMPWGEYIPFGDWFPWYRRLLEAWIPQIGDFEPGREYTVFTVSDTLRLAPMICYDATQVTIARGMAANGANLALVLANLAWFGPGTASWQFEHVIRFRAIENRMPLAFVSQNGRTALFDARGKPGAEILPPFATGALISAVKLPNLRSVYTRIGSGVDAAFVWLTLAVLACWWLVGRARRAPG